MKKMFSQFIAEKCDMEKMKSMVFGLSKEDAHAWLKLQLDISLKDWNTLSDFINLHCFDDEISFT